MAMISLMTEDRQQILASYNIDVEEIPREISLASHLIAEDGVGPLVINDTREDIRFATNPLVTDDLCIRFYFSLPLVSTCGSKIGSICIADTMPRPGVATEHMEAVKLVATIVMDFIHQRRESIDVEAMAKATALARPVGDNRRLWRSRRSRLRPLALHKFIVRLTRHQRSSALSSHARGTFLGARSLRLPRTSWRTGAT